MESLISEPRAEFNGFNDFYRDELLPGLISRDMERRRLVSKFIKTSVLIVMSMVAVAVFGYLSVKDPWPFILAGFGLIGGLGFAYNNLGQMKKQTKYTLVSQICSFIGWEFTPEEFTPIPLDNFLNYGLLSRPERSKYEDQMSGVAHGVNFVMHEAHLEREQGSGKNRRWVTTFRGVLISLDFPRKFLGQTILLRDAGLFNWKKKKGLKRVGLADPKFEKIFEAYGSDQVEARYLLHPVFMQTLVDLETLLSGKKLRAAFVDGKLLIAVSAPNQFEAGSMFKPLTDTARTQKIVDEIDTVFSIVDTVMTA